jgi:peptidoglycan hydrolase-like protein with peptidoglycan-binding domain
MKRIVCMRAAACLLLLCLFFAPVFVLARTAVPLPTGYGDTGLHVRLLQTELARRGYYRGDADGVYGDLTLKAVERYQRARHLPVDGQAGEKTLLALFAWTAAGSTLDSLDIGAPQTNGDAGGWQELPAPSGPGASGSHVKRLQEALRDRGYYLSEPDGAYDVDTLRAVADFQQDSGLKADGRAESDTIRVLFGKGPAKAGETQTLDWYAGGSDVIPWGAVFQVKDVRSGAIFTCRRMEGSSHMDVEPLTSCDTVAMLGAYHGEWRWDRRPVLLKYQGVVYAASMNGMPHGYISIRDNAMPGHFCIHFLGSRVQRSHLVSATHMECVIEASHAVW